MIKILTVNANGKIELTKKELEELLNQSFMEGRESVEKTMTIRNPIDMNHRRDFVYDAEPKLNVPSAPASVTNSRVVPTHHYSNTVKVEDAEKELADLLGTTPEELNEVFSELFGIAPPAAKVPNSPFNDLKKEVRGV